MPLSKKVAFISVGVLSVASYAAWNWLTSQYEFSRVAPYLRVRKLYSISTQLNKNGTGSAVCWEIVTDDQWYLFVRDFKKSANPIFLCHMNYTSTQGSYQAMWSKDRIMVAVYNESSAMFPEEHSPKWITGYDWKKGQALKFGWYDFAKRRAVMSDQIAIALAAHGGVGDSIVFPNRREPTSGELKQFALREDQLHS